MAPFVLKFKGNKSFSPLSQISDADTLTRTWKVCTKVAAHLEQGQRLENLSWRLWFLQCALVQSDNAKSKREFKKLSKSMSDKLDKDKGRSITELQAPNFKRTDSSDKVRARVEEMERNREYGKQYPNTQNGMKTMQYTFALDPSIKPLTAVTTTSTTAATNPTEDSHMRTLNVGSHAHRNKIKSGKPNSQHVQQQSNSDAMDTSDDGTTPSHHQRQMAMGQSVLRFPTIFSNDLGPTALLCAVPFATQAPSAYDQSLGAGDKSTPDSSGLGMPFSIARPVFEFPLDEFLKHDDPSQWASIDSTISPSSLTLTNNNHNNNGSGNNTNNSSNNTNSMETVQPTAITGNTGHQWSDNSTFVPSSSIAPASATSQSNNSNATQSSTIEKPSSTTPTVDSKSMGPPPLPSATKAANRQPPSATPPSRSGSGTATGATASATGNPGNTAPGGVKSECANCGATHTPLWRRGLNDELNCNACGLYCKLHKRARPKNLRAANAERSGGAWNKNSGGASTASATAASSTNNTSGSAGAGGATGAGGNATATTSTNTGGNNSSNTSTAASSVSPSAAVSNSAGAGGATTTEGDSVGDPVQCHNCATMATPLWRKDDEGNTLCNACGLYLKLHGSRRPLSMKSDVIRKRSRHESEKRSSISGGIGAPGSIIGGTIPPLTTQNSRRTSPTPPPASASSSSSVSEQQPYIGGLFSSPTGFNAGDNGTVNSGLVDENAITGAGAGSVVGAPAFDFGFGGFPQDFGFSTNTEDYMSSVVAVNDHFTTSYGVGGYPNMMVYVPVDSNSNSGGNNSNNNNQSQQQQQPNQSQNQGQGQNQVSGPGSNQQHHSFLHQSPEMQMQQVEMTGVATHHTGNSTTSTATTTVDGGYVPTGGGIKRRRLTAESNFSGSSFAQTTTGGSNSVDSSPVGGSTGAAGRVNDQSPPYFSLDIGGSSNSNSNTSYNQGSNTSSNGGNNGGQQPFGSPPTSHPGLHRRSHSHSRQSSFSRQQSNEAARVRSNRSSSVSGPLAGMSLASPTSNNTGSFSMFNFGGGFNNLGGLNGLNGLNGLGGIGGMGPMGFNSFGPGSHVGGHHAAASYGFDTMTDAFLNNLHGFGQQSPSQTHQQPQQSQQSQQQQQGQQQQQQAPQNQQGQDHAVYQSPQQHSPHSQAGGQSQSPQMHQKTGQHQHQSQNQQSQGQQGQQPGGQGQQGSNSGNGGDVVPGVTHDYYGFPIHPPMAPMHPPALMHPYTMLWHDPSQLVPVYLYGEENNNANGNGNNGGGNGGGQTMSGNGSTPRLNNSNADGTDMYVHSDMFDGPENGFQQQQQQQQQQQN